MNNLEEKKTKENSGVNSYMRYSGIGFQIAGSLGLGIFIGYELDKWLKTSKPYCTMFSGLLFLFVGMYFAFRDLLKNK
jgi:F0F1-type ATP synthase assembly protein I